MGLKNSLQVVESINWGLNSVLLWGHQGCTLPQWGIPMEREEPPPHVTWWLAGAAVRLDAVGAPWRKCPPHYEVIHDTWKCAATWKWSSFIPVPALHAAHWSPHQRVNGDLRSQPVSSGVSSSAEAAVTGSCTLSRSGGVISGNTSACARSEAGILGFDESTCRGSGFQTELQAKLCNDMKILSKDAPTSRRIELNTRCSNVFESPRNCELYFVDL